MIAPDKYVSLNRSLLGVGAAVIREMGEGKTITSLWEACKGMPEVGTFQRFVLALDLLFLLGIVEMNSGSIMRASNERESSAGGESG